MENFVVPLRPVLIFLVVLARTGGLMTFAPFWSHRAANTQVRATFALALAFVLTPIVMPTLATPPSEITALTVVLIGETLIGFLFGFAGRLIFSALETAAHQVGAAMGFNLAGTIDPATQANTAAFGTIAQMLGLMVLLGADGHHWFLRATVKSFAESAPGAIAVNAELVEIFLRLSSDALAVGVALAAPAIIVLLVVEFALAVVGHVAPQFQVFILGYPLKIAVGLWTIGASVYFLPAALRQVLSHIYQSLQQILATI